MKKWTIVILMLLTIGIIFIPTTLAPALAPDTDLSNADASFIGEDQWDTSGISVSIVGDVNGDGYDDLLIGAWANTEGGVPDTGQVYLILGKPTGWAMDTDLSNADASFIGEDTEDYAGIAISGAGDVNGDGFDDILIGAKGDEDGGVTWAGQTYLVLGKPSGWVMDTNLSNASASFWGEDADDESGDAISHAGDVNGDGFDDFLIGAPGDEEGGDSAGQTYLVLGKALGWVMDTDLSTADASFIGEAVHDQSGHSVSYAGDVNGDGYDDILIGSPYNGDGGSYAGQTYLFLGEASGWGMDTSLSMADASFWGEDSSDTSGWSVSGAGDVNSDGFDDFLIGANGDEDGGNYAGQTYLILGKASGWTMDTNLSTADASFIGEDASDQSGHCVSGAGDINGDGFDDFLIGADWDEDGGDNSGQTYLVFGKASGWVMDTDLSTADASFVGEDAWDFSGSSLSCFGDVNGDGYDDIIIGARGDDDGGSTAGQTYLVFSDTSGATDGTYKEYVGSGDTPAIGYAQANVTVDFSACTSSSGYLMVTEHNNQIPDIGNYINRYWSLQPSGLSAFTYNISFKYNDAEIVEAGGSESQLCLLKNDGGGWISVVSTLDQDHNILSATGQTSFSDWAIGTYSGAASYWPFDLGSGTIAYDNADGNDGIIYGATWTTGINWTTAVASGTLIWDVTENPAVGESTYPDVTTTVTSGADHIYVGGRQRLGGTYDIQARWQKRDKSDGSVVWTSTMDSGNYGDWINDIALNTTSGYGYIAPRYMPNAMGGYWHLEQFSLSDGSQGWTVTDSSEYGSTINALDIDSQYIYAVGGFEGPNQHWRVDKRSQSDGSLVWDQTVAHSSYDDVPFGIAIDSEYAYIVGSDEVNGDNDQQWRIEKRALSDGSLEWTQTVNPSSSGDVARSIAIDSGYAYIAGYDSSQGSDDYQWRIEKRALSDGSLEWTQTVNPGSGNETAYDIAIDSDYAYIAGSDNSPGGDDSQWRIEKRALSDGSLEWVETINPSNGFDYARGITIDSGHAYITGADNSPGGSDRQWKIEKRATDIRGKALYFDGLDDYVKVPGGVLDSGSDFTISMWMNPSVNLNESSDQIVFLTEKGRIYLTYSAPYDGAGYLGMRLWDTTGHDAVYDLDFPADNWYHIAGKFDGSNMTLYINGNSVDTVTGDWLDHPSYLKTTIGINRNETGSPFDGKIDEVRIYNRALSEQEIQSLYRDELVEVGIHVDLQGDGRPVSGWAVPISIGFFEPGANVMNATPLYSFSGTTSLSTYEGGTRAYFHCPDPVNPGIYDITVDSTTTLLNVKRNVGIW